MIYVILLKALEIHPATIDIQLIIDDRRLVRESPTEVVPGVLGGAVGSNAMDNKQP